MTNREIRDFLKLVKRSPGDSDGWKECGNMLWTFAKKMPEELMDREAATVGGRVRLTPMGDAVCRYSGS